MSNDPGQDYLKALYKKQEADQARAWKKRAKERERYAKEALQNKIYREPPTQTKERDNPTPQIEKTRLSCKVFYADSGDYKRKRLLEENKKLSEWKKNRSEKKIYEHSGS